MNSPRDLKNSRGKLVHMEISPDARNLEQLQVGDQVRVSYRHGHDP